MRYTARLAWQTTIGPYHIELKGLSPMAKTKLGCAWHNDDGWEYKDPDGHDVHVHPGEAILLTFAKEGD